MLVAVDLTGKALTAAAAFVGATGGLLAGWAAIIRARHEKDDECIERLNETRRQLGEIFDKWELERAKRLEAEEAFPGHGLESWGGGNE